MTHLQKEASYLEAWALGEVEPSELGDWGAAKKQDTMTHLQN